MRRWRADTLAGRCGGSINQKLGYSRGQDPEWCFCGDVNGWKKLAREIETFYTELLCKTFCSRWCLLSRRPVLRERVCWVGIRRGIKSPRGWLFQRIPGFIGNKIYLLFLSLVMEEGVVKFWKFNVYSAFNYSLEMICCNTVKFRCSIELINIHRNFNCLSGKIEFRSTF